MIKFEYIAYPFSRNDLLSISSAYKTNKHQTLMDKTLICLEKNILERGKYGFSEPKKLYLPEVANHENGSLLSKK